jgi:ATP-dependent RNA helicase SUPV3L1/SUV3
MFPFDEKDRDLKAIWHSLFSCERDGTERIFMSFLPALPDEDDSLEDLEQAFRICDLLYHYTDSFVGSETGELDTIARRKNQISAVIMEKLSSEQLSMRSCRICGRPLPFNYKYSVCVRCYRRSRGK